VPAKEFVAVIEVGLNTGVLHE